MEHIIQMAISVEDEKIVKRIEETAENQIIKTLTDKIEGIISEKHGWYVESKRDYTPLKKTWCRSRSERCWKIIKTLFFPKQARF